MSILRHINILQFKNHRQQSFAFAHRITGIVGKNGIGKTNLLDAVYYLCFARSYFTKSDKNLQSFEHLGFRIDGVFEQVPESLHLKCIFREDGKKELYINTDAIKKTSDYIGNAIAVMIAPDDISLINEGSEGRRKFIDTICCILNKQYMHHLQQYNKTLLQRNALLKELQETGKRDTTLLDIYDGQLVANGQYIYTYRKDKIAYLQDLFMQQYAYLAGSTDAITISYESHLQKYAFGDLLKQQLQKDLYAQRTNYGIHKDDMVFTMHKELLKNVASQGQKKTSLLSLKLAEYMLLQKETNQHPILLLDDIFERLDDHRIAQLFSLITTQLQCQVFITDTNKERLEKSLQQLGSNFEILEL
jgi:DNA replication and repair protein RecF